MIDIHCHILPSVDDGAKDMETSIAMLKMAEEKGTKTIIATPHYFAGYYEADYDNIRQKIEELREEAKKQNVNMELLEGQEICIDHHTIDKFQNKIISTLNRTDYMLLEFPLDKLPKYSIDTIYELKIRGVKPIIAHPERYLFFIEKPTLINQFIEEGCLFQLNTGSIKGIFGKAVQKTALKYIENNLCQFIASDAHSAGKRCPGIEENYIVDHKLYNIVENNAQKLINNEVIESTATKIQDTRFFIFHRK